MFFNTEFIYLHKLVRVYDLKDSAVLSRFIPFLEDYFHTV